MAVMGADDGLWCWMVTMVVVKMLKPTMLMMLVHGDALLWMLDNGETDDGDDDGDNK